MHAFHRQGLDFVKNQHAAGLWVDMPCAARTTAEPGIEKLHHGGKHNRLIPILGKQLVLPALFFGVEIRMVFQNPIFAEDVAHGLGILVDDGGIGNNVDNAVEIVLLRMMQGIAQTCQRFTAAGRHGQRVDALRVGGTFQADIGNSATDFVNFWMAVFKIFQIRFKLINRFLPIRLLGETA